MEIIFTYLFGLVIMSALATGTLTAVGLLYIIRRLK